MLFAAIANKIDKWLWIGYGLVILEGIVLAIFRFMCPLTILARKYSASAAYNFDIYLPNCLAQYNKQIYTSIMAVIAVITAVRLLQ